MEFRLSLLDIQRWADVYWRRDVPFREKWAAWQDVVGHPTIKARRRPDAFEMKVQTIINEELARFGGRRPTRAEWNLVADVIAARVASEVAGAFTNQARRIYEHGMRSVASELGMGAPVFGGKHAEAVRIATTGETFAESFAGFSEKTSGKLKEMIAEAVKTGKSSGLVQEMVREVGWRRRRQLETIANTEAFKIWTNARANTYAEFQEEEDPDEEWVYAFGFRQDMKTCKMCTEIMSRTRHGVKMEELKDIIIEVSTTPPFGNPKWDPTRDSEWPLTHPGCRHVSIRVQPEYGDLTPLASAGVVSKAVLDFEFEQKVWLHKTSREWVSKWDRPIKRYLNIGGIPVSVEFERGDIRSGINGEGERWEREMKAHYGRIPRTLGNDGEMLDAYVGPSQNTSRVWVVHQLKGGKKGGDFDEEKCLLGFASKKEAIECYLAHYPEGWEIGPVIELKVDEFKAWAKLNGLTKEWVHDPGPRSKDRWTNTKTGKHFYGSKPPSERGGGEDEGGGKRKPGEEKEGRTSQSSGSSGKTQSDPKAFANDAVRKIPLQDYRQVMPGAGIKDLQTRAKLLQDKMNRGRHFREYQAILREEGVWNLGTRLTTLEYPDAIPGGMESAAEHGRSAIAMLEALDKHFDENPDAGLPLSEAEETFGLINVRDLYKRMALAGGNFNPMAFSDEDMKACESLKDAIIANEIGNLIPKKTDYIAHNQAWVLATMPQKKKFWQEMTMDFDMQDVALKQDREHFKTALSWSDKTIPTLKKLEALGSPMPPTFAIIYGDNASGTFHVNYKGQLKSAIALHMNTHNLGKGWSIRPKTGFSATDGVEGTLTHEHGHFVNWHMERATYDGSLRTYQYPDTFEKRQDAAYAKVLKQDGRRGYFGDYVSDYACVHPLELVAETYASAHAGKKIPPAVFDEYVRWGGHVDEVVKGAVDHSLPDVRTWGVNKIKDRVGQSEIQALRSEWKAEFAAENQQWDQAKKFQELANRSRQLEAEDQELVEAHGLTRAELIEAPKFGAGLGFSLFAHANSLGLLAETNEDIGVGQERYVLDKMKDYAQQKFGTSKIIPKNTFEDYVAMAKQDIEMNQASGASDSGAKKTLEVLESFRELVKDE